MFVLGRFRQSVGRAAPYEFIDAADVGIRWNLESFGVERIEATIKAKSYLDVYDRINSHLGAVGSHVPRMAIISQDTNRPVSGVTVGVRPLPGNRVQYIGKGHGWRHFDNYGPINDNYTTATTTSAMINTYFLDSTLVTHISSNRSYIEESNTPIGAWRHDPRKGIYPGEAIKQFIKAASSSGQLWDYWLTDEMMELTSLRGYLPHFAERRTDIGVDWQVSIKDLSQKDIERSVADLRTLTVMWYGAITDTATGGSANTLIDSGATFRDGSFTPGDQVRNVTDKSNSRIVSIDSNTQLTISTLTGGSANTFSAGNVYAIERKALWNHEDVGPSTFQYLNRYHSEHHPELDQTQAAQLADAVFTQYSQPVMKTSFTITAPYIRDGSGATRPLWHMVVEGGGFLRVTDLFPSYKLLELNQDHLSTYRITSMDCRGGSLRVSVDDIDGRLDARLKAAAILGGEGIYV